MAPAAPAAGDSRAIVVNVTLTQQVHSEFIQFSGFFQQGFCLLFDASLSTFESRSSDGSFSLRGAVSARHIKLGVTAWAHDRETCGLVAVERFQEKLHDFSGSKARHIKDFDHFDVSGET